MMNDRQTMERLVRELHAARVGGEYNQLCGLFTDDAHFRIAGSSGGAPIEISVNGIAEIRPWLAIMLKTFRLADYQMLSSIIDGGKAAVLWRVNIHSKITGATVATELVDIIGVRQGRIASYIEVFVRC
jgi:ketosteroid isomerase-like protein